MNVFVTSPDPVACARALDDKRLVKMAVETGQILSTADPVPGAYRPTHSRHPVVLWAAEDPCHFAWLYRHFQALLEEYRYRFGREHGSGRLLALWAPDPAAPLPLRFQNCARRGEAQDFTRLPDVHDAYRRYLAARWETDARPPRWTNRGPPEWLALVEGPPAGPEPPQPGIGGP